MFLFVFRNFPRAILLSKCHFSFCPCWLTPVVLVNILYFSEDKSQRDDLKLKASKAGDEPEKDRKESSVPQFPRKKKKIENNF